MVFVAARQINLRATHGEVGLRRLEAQPPPGGFALSLPGFQLPGREKTSHRKLPSGKAKEIFWENRRKNQGFSVKTTPIRC